MAITSDVKLVTLGNLQTFKTAYDAQTADLYLSKSDFLTEGIIKADKLPSYVDDVIEIHVDLTDSENPVFYSDNNGARGNVLLAGEKDKIYVDVDATIDGTYRWSGSAFVPIGNSVSTADRAVNDVDGNAIKTTYATKTELTTASTTVATDSSTGVVKIGNNIDVDASGTISVATTSKASLGVVKVGNNIDVTDGTISVAIAGSDTLGVVKAGDNISIDANGVISAIVASTSEVNSIFNSGD